MLRRRESGLYVPDGRGPALSERMAHMQGQVVCELIDEATGRVDERKAFNTLTTGHRQLTAQWLAGQAPSVPDYIALGTGASEAYADTNHDTELTLKSTGADQEFAQGFQLSSNRNIGSVLLWMRRIGTSAATLTVDIQSDSAGDPSGTSLGLSDTFGFNSIKTTLDWVRFEFATPVSLLASTQYHLVLSASGYTYAASTEELRVGSDQSSPSYANGVGKTYNGASWSSISPATDLVFRAVEVPQSGDTTLVGETTRKQMTSKAVQGSTVARLLTNFITSEAVGRHGAAAVFNAGAGGTMSAAANIDIEKSNAQSLNVYWLITVN